METNQLDGVVKSLIEEIQGKLNKDIEKTIIAHVNRQLAEYDFEGKITLLASLKLDNKITNYQVNPAAVEAKIKSVAESVVDNLAKQARSQIVTDIARKIDSIDFDQSVTNAVAQQVEARMQQVVFPDNSISFSALKQEEIKVSGDQIQGGIITRFGSTGIDDRSNDCRITILDEHTVIENNLVVPSATVKGSLTVEGDLVLNGEIPTDSQAFRNLVAYSQASVMESLDEDLFNRYRDNIFEKITTDGIDLTKITIGNETVIEDNRIGTRITESNLQKLGTVRDLQTRGETFLSEALYVGSRRVGINTIEPSHALSLWDQEIEIIAGKQSQSTAFLGTSRAQDFVLGSNSKNNLTCRPDGSVVVANIVVGTVAMTSADATPTNDQPKGSIVWNSNPQIGESIGWVSLGGARWASFGTISA